MSIELRALFLGMSGPFSHIVLQKLLAAEVKVVTVLLAGQQFRPLRTGLPPGSSDAAQTASEFELPVLNPHISFGPRDRLHRGNEQNNTVSPLLHSDSGAAGPLHLAQEAGIPAYECGDIGRPDVLSRLADLSLDVACVACWHRIIPPSALGIPRYGFLNVHPSLLPAYRGPHPLFWQFQAGETETGVTVHLMDAGMDTGDITGQRRVQLPDGIQITEAEALCASVGGELLAETLAGLGHGKSERQPQTHGSYFPSPTLDDFALDTNWDVRRAFNFMRATAEYGVPFRLEIEGAVHWLRDALAWQEGEASESAGDSGVCIRFRDGAMWAEEWRGPPA